MQLSGKLNPMLKRPQASPKFTSMTLPQCAEAQWFGTNNPGSKCKHELENKYHDTQPEFGRPINQKAQQETKGTLRPLCLRFSKFYRESTGNRCDFNLSESHFTTQR
jgi:hypothetical protein